VCAISGLCVKSPCGSSCLLVRFGPCVWSPCGSSSLCALSGLLTRVVTTQVPTVVSSGLRTSLTLVLTFPRLLGLCDVSGSSRLTAPSTGPCASGFLPSTRHFLRSPGELDLPGNPVCGRASGPQGQSAALRPTDCSKPPGPEGLCSGISAICCPLGLWFGISALSPGCLPVTLASLRHCCLSFRLLTFCLELCSSFLRLFDLFRPRCRDAPLPSRAEFRAFPGFVFAFVATVELPSKLVFRESSS
jgi:hypothetical protein